MRIGSTRTAAAVLGACLVGLPMSAGAGEYGYGPGYGG